MTFYQELQLDQAGSKNYIAQFKAPKQKFVHILTYLFKIVLNVGFSMGVIILLGVLFGFENCIAGLVVVLCITTFRFTDFDIPATHSVGGVFFIFALFALGPKAANLAPIGCDWFINFFCILLIVLIACHNVRWSNHSILLISYLLLHSYDVSGESYINRLYCLLLGAVLTALIMFFKQRKKEFRTTFADLFGDFRLSDPRSRWQIRIALCVSGAVFFAALLGVPKPVWAGIAAMAVTIPQGDVFARVGNRIRGNVMGDLLFILAYVILPSSTLSYFGMIGGFGAGLCARYEGQTAWNSFSALSIAVSSIGMVSTVVFRLVNNLFGAAFAVFLGAIVDRLLLLLSGGSRRKNRMLR